MYHLLLTKSNTHMTTKTSKRRTTSKVLKEVPKDPNQRAIKSLFPTRKVLRKSLALPYQPPHLL
jgi:hypothetical protein